MMKSKSLPILAGAAAAALVFAFASPPATADIIKSASVSTLAQGFGSVPRLLTVMANGTEFACDSPTAGGLSQSCAAPPAGADATFQPNGLINGTVGSDGTQSPASDSNKNNIVSLSGIGVTNANQILISYNPSQQGGNQASDIQDLTLKFYDANNNLIISVDGGCGTKANCLGTASDPLLFNTTGTNQGNGGVGFILVLDQTQATQVNSQCGLLTANPICTKVAGETTIALANDGPDSFTLFSSAVPAPLVGHGLLVLLAVGGVLFGSKLLERSKRRDSSVAV
jgi:hypothetical protein